VELEAGPAAPGLARSFARHAVRTWSLDELADDVELITSELVTNAVRATRISGLALVVIELQVDNGALRIAVKDSSRARPSRQVAGDDAEGGRGLFLVEALSTRWDCFLVRGGKVVWAELALVPSVPRAGPAW
jgi:anti-sigma regulatory factor (Ser/Thr protein kinase)